MPDLIDVIHCLEIKLKQEASLAFFFNPSLYLSNIFVV